MTERLDYRYPLDSAIALINKKGQIDSLETHFLERLADKFWTEEFEAEIMEEGRKKFEESSTRKAVDTLISDYPDIAGKPAREILEDKFGFDSEDYLSNSDSLVILFKIVGHLRHSFSDAAIGRQLRRPFAHFHGKTRLEMVKEGNYVDVIQHIEELSNGGGT